MILTDENFDHTINTHKKILVDFWAPWCGPCQLVSPILDEIASEHSLWVGKLNIDEHSVKPEEYSVQSIPTMILFIDGNPVKTIVGAMPKHKLLKELEQWI